jgi:hypothetical protein
MNNWDTFASDNEATTFFSYHYRRCPFLLLIVNLIIFLT